MTNYLHTHPLTKLPITYYSLIILIIFKVALIIIEWLHITRFLIMWYTTILEKWLVENILMLGHSPKCIHMVTYAWFANVVSHELNSKKILIWGLIVLSLYYLMKGPNMAILKWPNLLVQSYPNLAHPTMWCLARNVGVANKIRCCNKITWCLEAYLPHGSHSP